jgi:hypothetical protein
MGGNFTKLKQKYPKINVIFNIFANKLLLHEFYEGKRTSIKDYCLLQPILFFTLKMKASHVRRILTVGAILLDICKFIEFKGIFSYYFLDLIARA